jgi:ABC-2 type transport system permease protein
VILQALFYAIPIIYPISMIASTSRLAANVILIDPIAQVIQDVRFCLITPETVTSWNYIGIWGGLVAILIVIVVLLVGSLVFRKKSKFFAEEI